MDDSAILRDELIDAEAESYNEETKTISNKFL